MWKRRRSNVEIMAEILRLARYGAKKTGIVYKANLNFKLLKQYLYELNKNGMIMNENGAIQTTEKGIEYLKRYNSFMNILVFDEPYLAKPT